MSADQIEHISEWNLNYILRNATKAVRSTLKGFLKRAVKFGLSGEFVESR